MLEEKSEKFPLFLKELIDEDLKIKGQEGKSIITRFPPEPNGYLHLGHAKSIFLNFKIVKRYGGKLNLRFDDTNPLKEQQKYVESILEDIEWLGLNQNSKIFYTSDYFIMLYNYALKLIKLGKAYVDDLSLEQIHSYRGSLVEPGKDSPFRDRSVNENLDLFNKMKLGLFEDGEKILRAKIRMDHPNILMRDPVIYRIRKVNHHRTGNKWCIYPMYDFAHCISDMIEGVSYSLCTSEFENNRELYEWILKKIGAIHFPKQIEFARLNLSYSILSKRKINYLVKNGYIEGWDDPRLLTISGLRRRGYSSESIKSFCELIGVGKRKSLVDIALLEHSIRENLNLVAKRVMGVINPLKVVIINYPKGNSEDLQGINHPNNPGLGTRIIPFSREIYIEKDDFLEDPPNKFFRLAPGREVRLRYAFFIKCVKVVKNENNKIVEIHCTYDPKTKGGKATDGRKVKATLHWVSALHGIDAEVRLYDRLLIREHVLDKSKLEEILNPKSLKVLRKCKVESSLKNAKMNESYQFERLGYFCLDSKDSEPNSLVFNRTASLRDNWIKIKKKN